MNNFNLMKMEKNTIRTKIQIKKTTFILTVLSFIILNFFLAFFINVDTIKSRVEAGYFFTADFHKNVSRDRDIEVRGSKASKIRIQRGSLSKSTVSIRCGYT